MSKISKISVKCLYRLDYLLACHILVNSLRSINLNWSVYWWYLQRIYVEGAPKLNMLDSYSKDNLLPFWFVFMLLSNRMIVFIDRKSKIHPRYLIKFLFFLSLFRNDGTILKSAMILHTDLIILSIFAERCQNAI